MKSTSISLSSVLIAIVGIVMFSAKAVMVKLAYQYDVSSLHLLVFRMVFALPFYLGLLYFFRPQNPIEIRNSDYVWLILFGFIGYYLASYFDFLGLKYIKAGLERIILFVYPTLVLLISRIFLKTKITTKQLIAILITYVGVVIAFWGEINLEGSNIALGAFLIFLSALTYASYLVGSGWLIPKFGVMAFTSLAMIVSTVCVVAHYGITDRGDLLNYPYQVYLLGFLMAIISTLIPSFLVSLAIKRMGANNFSIFGSIGPISTIILAYLFLDERLSTVQFIGAFIVILGVIFISKSKKKTS
ncbi:DMT family transporter [Urechidicola vernalis]|uniref:DMT family transporter n=1 Tax=Urechidicola vernalis TaxID=3075600 RepID=A0ABU2Y1J7_9FLAO|nr:DMT family transporter [Urechidicola sp. P050]MDT0552052.1 DMT family transporter [Urechidicola sp. P050]